MTPQQRLCRCGQEIKITGDRCESCWAESMQYVFSSRTGLNLKERVKYRLYQALDANTGGTWRKRGRRVSK